MTSTRLRMGAKRRKIEAEVTRTVVLYRRGKMTQEAARAYAEAALSAGGSKRVISFDDVEHGSAVESRVQLRKDTNLTELRATGWQIREAA